MSWIPCLGSVVRLAFLFRSGLYIGSRREKPLLVINYYKTLHRGPVALVCKIKGLNSHPLFTQIATALGSPCLGQLTHTHTETNGYTKTKLKKVFGKPQMSHSDQFYCRCVYSARFSLQTFCCTGQDADTLTCLSDTAINPTLSEMKLKYRKQRGPSCALGPSWFG